MNVEQLMTRSIATCAATDTLQRAARTMWEHDCGVVPVVDGDGRVIAMITDSDICMAAYTQGKPIADLPVSSAASKNIVVTRMNDTVHAAEELMKKHKIRRLPVVDDRGCIVGLLSLNDLARHAGRRADDLDTSEVTRTLGAICQPNKGPFEGAPRAA